ncbi:MAG: hypothetical protein J0H49_12505 [Acidobacteria bacterium]|nr:hypothetical protein [Acidobacteriota bacterium]
MHLLLWFLVLHLSEPSQSSKPLSVCEVLADLQSYRGKVISVRGQLLRGEEGSYLTSDKCARPLETNGYTWKNPIPLSLLPGSADIAVSAQSRERLIQASANTDKAVWVTYAGRLETRTSFEMVHRGDGQVVPYGYGHLNACPAELIFTEIRDVVFGPSAAEKKK